MTPRCACGGPLYPCDLLSGLTTCVECARRALRASRAGTHANVTAAIALRDQGQQQASDARPDDRARVDAAIRAAAATGLPFSANSIRSQHGVKGPVVGAAFTAARKAGLIERIGREASTDPGTHGHEVGTWRGVNQIGAVA